MIGVLLFFDPRLSVDGTRSCYSCHQNENGNGGETPLAVGAKGKQLTRHSPVIWNTAYFDRFYWDGRADSLEAQAKGAWGGGNMGVGKENLAKKTKALSKIKVYRESFAKVFPEEGMTPDTVAKAIAAYERTLICNNTAYDRFAKGDESALTDQQKEGVGHFHGQGPVCGVPCPPHFSLVRWEFPTASTTTSESAPMASPRRRSTSVVPRSPRTKRIGLRSRFHPFAMCRRARRTSTMGPSTRLMERFA